MINNLHDCFKIIEKYTDYLEMNGMEFGRQGEPIFKRNMFLDGYPQGVVPYDHRNSKLITNKHETVICFFSPDQRIYPRFEKIFDELDEYKKFKGVIAPDVTITEDMDLEYQKFTMRLIQLFMAILAVNKIKIVANLRSGNFKSLETFSNIPKNVLWATSFLGCPKDSLFDNRFISSVIFVMPSKILLYGKDDFNATNRLNIMGFDYQRFSDFHQLSKEAR